MATETVVLASNQHGKSKVRLGRVWREGPVHHIVEWNVNISLLSDSAPSYLNGDNSGVVATDTMKNTVYVLGKRSTARISPEEFAVMIAKHFVSSYDVVSGAMVEVTEKPWIRTIVDGREHNHGFKLGQEKHTVYAEYHSCGKLLVKSGIEDLSLLKTTQSGFEKFIRDKYTLLPDTRERIVASSVKAEWTYSGVPPGGYSAAFEGIKSALSRAFFGPPVGGTYSPAVQTTLYSMGKSVIEKYPEVESIYLNMPNLHFIPVNIPSIGVPFEDDVYLPTSEPHGSIEATVARPKKGVIFKSNL